MDNYSLTIGGLSSFEVAIISSLADIVIQEGKPGELSVIEPTNLWSFLQFVDNQLQDGNISDVVREMYPDLKVRPAIMESPVAAHPDSDMDSASGWRSVVHYCESIAERLREIGISPDDGLEDDEED